jgi:hypothetical protein
MRRIVMRLDWKAFALTCGILWGLCLFLVTWWLLAFGGSTAEVEWLGNFYFGYRATPIGSLIGLAYGLVDGAIAGAIFAGLYNYLTRFLGRNRAG